MTVGRILLERGRYRAELVETPAGLAAAQALRGRAFGVRGADRDALDGRCRHVLLRETGAGRAVGCFRMLDLDSGAGLGGSYAAQFYDLSRLSAFAEPMLEIGRFCTVPELSDPDLLRVAWGAITAVVDARGVGMLFGCTTFAGLDPGPYRGAFALLRARHAAPDRWRPGVKAAEIVRFGGLGPEPEDAAGLRAVPPLLRTYLGMGGWVSDHAVVDRGLGTLHVFTAVEVAAIPPGRKRALRAVLSG